MGFVNFIVELLKDPRAAIASWIAMGVAPTLGFIFLIVVPFISTLSYIYLEPGDKPSLALYAVVTVIALALAAVAALGGPAADTVVSWLIDLIMGIPHIVLLVLVSYALGRGAAGVMVGIALTHWPSLARVLRAEILQLRAQPYLACSEALGVGPVRLALTHIVPHVLPQYLVGLVLLFPHAILHEASITFLGFGLSPEQPAIGVILSEAMGYLTAGSWWLAVFPGLALLTAVLLFDRIGSAVRALVTPEEVQR